MSGLVRFNVEGFHVVVDICATLRRRPAERGGLLERGRNGGRITTEFGCRVGVQDVDEVFR